MDFFKPKDNTGQNESDRWFTDLDKSAGSRAIWFDEVVDIASFSEFHHEVIVFVISESTV